MGEDWGEGWSLALAVETHAGSPFKVWHLAVSQAGVVDESVADRTALPAPFEHGGVTIQDLVAYPAAFRLDAQEQGFPFARAIPDTHGREV